MPMDTDEQQAKRTLSHWSTEEKEAFLACFKVDQTLALTSYQILYRHTRTVASRGAILRERAPAQAVRMRCTRLKAAHAQRDSLLTRTAVLARYIGHDGCQHCSDQGRLVMVCRTLTVVPSAQQHGRDWRRLDEAVPGKTLVQIKNYFQNYKAKLGLDRLALPAGAVAPRRRRSRERDSSGVFCSQHRRILPGMARQGVDTRRTLAQLYTDGGPLRAELPLTREHGEVLQYS